MAQFEFLGRLSERFDSPVQLSIPDDVTTIAALRPWLDKHFNCEVFAHPSIRAIVNQDMAMDMSVISNHDIIVFYPPVGGG